MDDVRIMEGRLPKKTYMNTVLCRWLVHYNFDKQKPMSQMHTRVCYSDIWFASLLTYDALNIGDKIRLE